MDGLERSTSYIILINNVHVKCLPYGTAGTQAVHVQTCRQLESRHDAWSWNDQKCLSVQTSLQTPAHRVLVQHSNEENMGKVTKKTQKHIFFTMAQNKKHRDMSN